MDTGGRGQQGDRLQQRSALSLLESPELPRLDPSAHPVDMSNGCSSSSEPASSLLCSSLPGFFLVLPSSLADPSLLTRVPRKPRCAVGLLCDCICLNKLTVNEGSRSGL